MAKNNIVGYFEIPVVDMKRAVKFYEAVFLTKLERHMMGPMDMAWFPMVKDGPGTTGSLVLDKNFRPSVDGVLIFFSSPKEDINGDLKKVEKAGGKIVAPRMEIPENMGFMAMFLDTEGNRIGLHSMK
jgi:uncharacterized protein